MANTTPRRGLKLPPGVVPVKRKGGIVRYRAWFSTGESGGKKWLEVCDDPDVAYAMRVEALKLTAELPANLVTFQQAAERVRQELVALDRKSDTLRWFNDHARRLEEIFGPDTPLASITPADIESKVRDARRSKTGRRLSAATIGHRRRALSRILALAVRQGKLAKNPLDAVGAWPRIEAKAMNYFTAEEVADLLARIKDSGKPTSSQDHDLIALAFLTGLRRAELARLHAEHVDLRRARVQVDGKKRRQPIALGGDAVAVLTRMLARTPSGPLIPEGVHGVARVFHRWAVALKEPRLTPHAMRHSFVTALVRSGQNVLVVQRLARHESVSMTSRYFHAGDEDAAALSALTIKPAKGGAAGS